MEQVQPYKGTGAISKQQLADLYKMSRNTLRNLLNRRYFEILKEVGYKKTMKILPPIVVHKFIEIYGEPL